MATVVMFIISVVLSSALAVPLSVLDESKCSTFEYEYRVLEKIINLENANVELGRKQRELELQNQELMKIVKEQSLEMKSLKQVQEEERKNVTKFIEDLEQVNMEQDKERTNMNKVIEDMERVNIEQDEERKNMTKGIEMLERGWMRGSVTRASFSATLGQDKKYTGAETIVFRAILNNDGDAYDANTGIFTAPARGKYWFSFSISVYHQAFANVYIMKNSDKTVLAFPDRRGYGNNNWETATASTVMDLQFGDTVYCRWISGTTTTSYSVKGTSSTTFSGILLIKY